MIDFFKYLPLSQNDQDWGLSVINAGRTNIKPFTNYPNVVHPGHHHFNWERWRVLDEYQIIYITSGQGIFESDSCPQIQIQAGTIIILFPNETHRYRPSYLTGWQEQWIGIKGTVIDKLVASGYLSVCSPCFNVGFNEKVMDLFEVIIENVRNEKPGYQPLVSGAGLYLIGMCHADFRQNQCLGKEEEVLMEKARLLLRSNICNVYSIQQLASELNVGYSWFRKLFKLHGGLSPGQYYLQLKIAKAKELLLDQHLAIKAISSELNFKSSFYFSRIFRDKVGLSPSAFRKTHCP
ncbi:AraC family transcriptional regulator [Pedobacter frigidisoli]|uniref:AraC family transcriptional regulator n=1 Tax=Pedobacter frigidisoli TaxID=2530455 RepID=UPI0029308260|nr:AraC family transcriptional regulator [Pedobacter frigidisoli]